MTKHSEPTTKHSESTTKHCEPMTKHCEPGAHDLGGDFVCFELDLGPAPEDDAQSK